MSIKSSPLYIIFVLFLVCCTNNPSPQDLNPSCLNIKIEQEGSSSFNLSTISDTASYIKLETNDSCLLDYIKKIYGVKKHIIIGSNRSVLFFDRNGHFEYSIKRIGSAPHEYLRFTDFCINENLKRIYILDSQQQKFITYNFNGDYIRHDNLGFWAIGIESLNDSTIIMYHGNQKSPKQTYKLTFFNTNTHQITKQYYPIANNKSKFLHVRNENNFAMNKKGLALCELYNDTIYALSEEGIRPYYYIDFGNRKISTSILNNTYGNIIEFQNEIVKHPYDYGINSLIESSDYLLFTYYANHKRVLCYYDKKSKKAISYKDIIDPILSDEIPIDIRTNHITFHSDADEIFMIADNSLYTNKEIQILRENSSLSDTSEEDNPIIRINKKWK